MDQAKKEIKELVTLNIFNEETGYIKSLIIQQKGAGGKSGGGASARGPPASMGGLTAAQKSQMKDMVEKLEIHDSLIKKNSKAMQAIDPEAMKVSLALVSKSLKERVENSRVEALEMMVT